MADYAPWTEDGLRRLLAYHKRTALTWKEGTRYRAEHEQYAKDILDALVFIAELKNVKLEEMAELRGELGRLRAELEAKDAA